MSISLRIDVITSFPELLALGPEWRALEAATGTDVPFQSWEWAISWWRHLHDDSPGVSDSLRVCALRTDSGQLVGIAPLMMTERPSVGPLRLRFVQFIGADPNITELRSMLCLPAVEEDCYAAVLEYLSASSAEWDWTAWEGLQSSSRHGALLIDELGFAQEKSAFVLDLAPTWDEFKRSLGRNIKESLRKCYNSLKRDGLSCSLRVIEEPQAITSALEAFFALHAARANLETTVSHPDVFAQPRSRAFLEEVCERLAARGTVRIFQLWVDDRLVATRIGFVMSDTLYLYFSGWDPEYGRYSVMTTLLAEVIQDAIVRGLKHVHLSTGADVSKTRWGAREVRFVSGRQLSPNRRVRTFRYVFKGAIRVQNNTVARSFAPTFMARGAACATVPEPGRRRAAPLWRLGTLVPAVVVLAALDLLDGRLDGVVNLLPRVLGRHLG